MTAEAAHWAVESWALALGVIDQPSPVVKPALVSPPSPPPTVPKVAPAPQTRPTETLMAGRYRDNGDGTVTDVKTGLQWMRFSLGQKWKDGTCMGEAKQYPWREALDAAEALNCQGGYAGCLDWRLPTKKELQTLVAGKSSPTIDRAAFPNTLGWWYWSSSSDAGDPHYALVVDFSSGVVYADYRASNGRVRLVHGGQ
ncbi:MAG: DUF1566 domain-containing protein [Candidatus Competibacteraceae bacterium]|nr:MAG: DUF1566 domain-containing protein [Candidatus Competibacteraceae bacterium]